MLVQLYGPTSPQLTLFNKTIRLNDDYQATILAARGVLSNIKAEINSGLVGNLRQQIAGDVLSDFMLLSRTVLEDKTTDAKNVAAVLAAAAFEDTIRRMGAHFAGITGKNDLQIVITKLKDTGILQSPQLGIAQSFLSFRNHAMHANWDKIEREAVQIALGFVQELLLKHFS